jgi:hypothetical protein
VSKLKVWVGVIETKHGANVYASRTRDGLVRQLADFCREYCLDAGLTAEKAAAMPDQQVIDLYFEAVHGESVFIEPGVEVEP